jgi:hypothetical protein
MKMMIFGIFSLALTSTAFASASREHCKAADGRLACFIEVENAGESNFYTSTGDYENLLLDDQVAALNIEIKELALTDYAALYEAQHPVRFVYESASVTAFDFSANQPCLGSANGWWQSWGKCAAGTTGGAILGGLSGAGLGPVGAGLGAVGGGLAGAAASCGSTIQVRYRESTIEMSLNC